MIAGFRPFQGKTYQSCSLEFQSKSLLRKAVNNLKKWAVMDAEIILLDKTSLKEFVSQEMRQIN